MSPWGIGSFPVPGEVKSGLLLRENSSLARCFSCCYMACECCKIGVTRPVGKIPIIRPSRTNKQLACAFFRLQQLQFSPGLFVQLPRRSALILKIPAKLQRNCTAVQLARQFAAKWYMSARAIRELEFFTSRQKYAGIASCAAGFARHNSCKCQVIATSNFGAHFDVVVGRAPT